MVERSTRLRVAVATPLRAELCALVEEIEPRVQMVRDAALLPPPRWPSDHDGDPSFERTPEQQRDFEALLAGADAFYGIPDERPASLHRAVEANPGLRWVHTMAAGGGAAVRSADLTGDQLERVAFTTSAGVHGTPLAEFALFGLLSGAKQLPRLLADTGAHRWPERWFMGQLSEQTVLVLGLGGIGREVVRLLAALGTHVIGTSRHGRPVEGVDELVHPDDLADVVARVDGVVVTLPGTEATKGLVSAQVLAAVRPGTTFVNVGRGSVVDEDALVEALRAGRVGFAALDVTATEPLPEDSPLWELPGVLVSPHTAAMTPAEERRIAELFADNAGRLLDGRELRNRVDTVEFY